MSESGDEFAKLLAHQQRWSQVVNLLGAAGVLVVVAVLAALLWWPRSLVLAAGVPAVALCVLAIGWAHHKSVQSQSRALASLERSQQAVNDSLRQVMRPLDVLQDRIRD